MKITKAELKKMNKEQLHAEAEKLRHEYFKIRIDSATAHIKDYSQFKKFKKALARALTFLNQV